MKKIYMTLKIFILIFLVLLIASVIGCTANAEEILTSQAEITSRAQSQQKEINNTFEKFTGIKSETVINDIVNGDVDFMVQVADVFLGEIKGCLSILLQILAISIVQAVLSNSGIGLSRTNLDAASMACTICMVAISITNVSKVIIDSQNTITNSSVFLHATFPSMVSLSAMTGNAGVALAVSPMLFFVAEIIVSLMSTVVFPLLSASLAFAAAEVFVDKKVLKGVSCFIRKTCYWVIGMMTVVFTAVTAIKGIVGGTSGIGTSKLLKCFFKFIPVVGDMVSDSLETIVGGLSVIKSVSGVVVIVGVAIIVAVPLIKMFAIGTIYKAAGMLAEALGAQQGATFVKEAGSTVITAAGMSIVVGIMFIVVIAAIVSATTV